jgi:FkbH-like protein
VARLSSRGESVAALSLTLALDDHTQRAHRIEAASPTRDVTLLVELARLRLASDPLSAPVKELDVVVDPAPVRGEQLALFAHDRARDRSAADRALARVRAALPDVVAVQLPKNTADYAATLDNLVFFDSLRMTETDKLRSELYQQQRLRETERRAAGTVEEFLAGLGVVIDGHQARPSELPRIAQLFQRTNQFNTTTRRYTERDVQSFSASPGHRLYAFEVQDRFGAHGLTGVALVDTSTSGIWRLDSLVLSCRVLGLTVEKAIGLKLARDARRAGARALRGDFRPTPKNTPAAGYFANMGYTLIEKQSDLCVWELQLGSSIPDYDAWIEFREESVTTPEEQT